MVLRMEPPGNLLMPRTARSHPQRAPGKGFLWIEFWGEAVPTPSGLEGGSGFRVTPKLGYPNIAPSLCRAGAQSQRIPEGSSLAAPGLRGFSCTPWLEEVLLHPTWWFWRRKFPPCCRPAGKSQVRLQPQERRPFLGILWDGARATAKTG